MCAFWAPLFSFSIIYYLLRSFERSLYSWSSRRIIELQSLNSATFVSNSYVVNVRSTSIERVTRRKEDVYFWPWQPLTVPAFGSWRKLETEQEIARHMWCVLRERVLRGGKRNARKYRSTVNGNRRDRPDDRVPEWPGDLTIESINICGPSLAAITRPIEPRSRPVFSFVFLLNNWVLYSTRGSASKRICPSRQPHLDWGDMGTSADRELQWQDHLLQATSRREWTLWLWCQGRQTQRHEIRVGRTEKVDGLSDLGRGRDQRRWRASELSYHCQNSRGRYVSLTSPKYSLFSTSTSASRAPVKLGNHSLSRLSPAIHKPTAGRLFLYLNQISMLYARHLFHGFIG